MKIKFPFEFPIRKNDWVNPLWIEDYELQTKARDNSGREYELYITYNENNRGNTLEGLAVLRGRGIPIGYYIETLAENCVERNGGWPNPKWTVDGGSGWQVVNGDEILLEAFSFQNAAYLKAIL
jgi:hypothetical protein